MPDAMLRFLQGTPPPGAAFLRRLQGDFEAFREGLPAAFEQYVRERYGCDLAARYGGIRVRSPFGKASGQLSLNLRQVSRDAESQLAFVVLKTVIAEDAGGGQAMAEWAIPETRMRVERIEAGGEPGWTVTWKGRGWSGSLDDYCRFVGEAAAVGRERGMLIVPSAKYHLPPPGETQFRRAEYEHTTLRLQQAWGASCQGPMPLEKDFSPTLAGDDRSRERDQICLWLREVPDLIRAASAPGTGLHLGLKLMNARFEPEFQVEMARTAIDEPSVPPDFLVYANRLFDPGREFEGKLGVACGGPELSARNLACLDLLRAAAGGFRRPVPPLSGTGDILTGRRALEYALRGATSCQMHTLFQLPDGEFAATTRSKTTAVLHHLVFHPESGLLAWMERLRAHLGRRSLDWLDLPAAGETLAREHAAAPQEGVMEPRPESG